MATQRGALSSWSMRAVVATAWLASLAVGTAFGAPPTNFTGTWKVDVARSTPTAGGGRYFNQDASLSEIVLVITQTPEELVIERSVGDRVGKSVIRLDGSANEVEGPRGGRYTARTKWDGPRLVTEGTQLRQGPNGEVEVQVTEIRELTPDGKTMTVTTTMKAPLATNTRKLVFVKQE